MGIYDRDYYREQPRPQYRLRGPRTVVGAIILINVAFFLANGLLTPPKELGPSDVLLSKEQQTEKAMGWITYHMAVKMSTLSHLLRW